jgi:hypothetical protein
VLIMPFESTIRRLSDELVKCRDDRESLRIAQELHAVLHEKIEQLREKAMALPLLRHGQPKK